MIRSEITYGSFAARRDGSFFPETHRVRSDFAAIAASRLNTVRTYTLTETDVLDAAREAGLRLLIGLQYDNWLTAGRPGRTARRRVLDAGQRAVADPPMPGSRAIDSSWAGWR